MQNFAFNSYESVNANIDTKTIQAMQRAWRAGANGPQISAAFNVPVHTVHKLASDKKRGFIPVSEHEKKWMNDLHTQNYTMDEIAAMTGRSLSTVYKYVERTAFDRMNRSMKISRGVNAAYRRNYDYRWNKESTEEFIPPYRRGVIIRADRY